MFMFHQMNSVCETVVLPHALYDFSFYSHIWTTLNRQSLRYILRALTKFFLSWVSKTIVLAQLKKYGNMSFFSFIIGLGKDIVLCVCVFLNQLYSGIMNIQYDALILTV